MGGKYVGQPLGADLAEICEVEVVGELEQQPECDRAGDVAGSLFHGGGEQDHELASIGSGRVTLLDDLV
jgi:hypothetical protein